MKPRARRVTMGVAVLGAFLVAVLAIACWDTIREHVMAWRFQFTRETMTMEPRPEGMTGDSCRTEGELLQFAADRLRCPVIVDPREVTSFHVGRVSGQNIRETLEREGWRVFEQRIPRTALVLSRPEPAAQTILWDGVDLPAPEK